MVMTNITTAQKPVFCCRLQFISVQGTLGRGERLDENFFITNDRATIATLMPEIFEPGIGRMEYRSFKESPVAAYARLDNLPPGSEQSRLLEHLLLLDAFENVFWLHADSCVGHELAFLHDKSRGGIWSNIYEGLRTRSDSSQDTLTITASTLRELVRVYRSLLKPGKVDPQNTSIVKGQIETKSGLAAKVTNSAPFRLARIHTRTNSNRITRALNHVGRAQKTGMFTEKITFYCSALEALFSTSHFELSHQIAERVAVTGALSKSDRLVTYRFVKDCYSFRSKYIHGAPLKAADELKLEGMCQKLDALVRQSFHKVLGDETLCKVILSDGDLDELMLARLFE
jgi:hypothetical protein